MQKHGGGYLPVINQLVCVCLYIHGWEWHIANMKFYKKDKEYCISSCHFVWRTCQGCHLGLAKRIFWTTCTKYQHTVRRLQPIKKVHMHVEQDLCKWGMLECAVVTASNILYLNTI